MVFYLQMQKKVLEKSNWSFKELEHLCAGQSQMPRPPVWRAPPSREGADAARFQPTWSRRPQSPEIEYFPLSLQNIN